VDNPQLFDQIANVFVTQAAMKFMILLWWEKSELKNREMLERFPVFSYDEIIERTDGRRDWWPVGLMLAGETDGRREYVFLSFFAWFGLGGLLICFHLNTTILLFIKKEWNPNLFLICFLI